MNLSDSVSSIKGIGSKKAEVLEKAGIKTCEDLIYYFPRSYEDRRKVTPIAELMPQKEALVVARVMSVKSAGFYRKNAPLSLLVNDGSGTCEIVYFNARFLSKLFKVNEEYAFYGRVTENYARMQMVHPEFCKTGATEDQRGIIPVYPPIQGISQRELRRMQQEIAPCYDELREWMPESIVTENRLADPAYAVRNLHFPEDGKKVLESKFRMIFGELLTLQTGLMYIRAGSSTMTEGAVIDCSHGDRFAEGLPFELTEGQKKAWEDIKADLEGSGRMNRLLQGDVGSGKTAVAEMAMFSAAGSGMQSVIMAPTELLARQHFETFQKDFEQYGIRIALLTSASTAKEKEKILADLESGDISVLIATHAALQDNVKFADLGLVITDEQHRFGVEQRRRLSAKGRNANILVMTATPIPRTLAVILYGDLDVSQIRTMPKGRKPVKTTLVRQEDRKKAYDAMRAEVSRGRQGYVVAPLIEASESIDANSAEDLYRELLDEFREFSVALVHGAMKQEDKENIMRSFAEGDVDILVSTVVIEVGINVPNATVMIIENQERFGLAQLHQLRGRVGRGSDTSYCFLIAGSETEVAMKRAEIMCGTSDGFEIAEEDLKLRGPGELFGTRQHGLPQLEVADLMRHHDVLVKAGAAARKVIAEDPALAMEEHAGLKSAVKKMFGDDIELQL